MIPAKALFPDTTPFIQHRYLEAIFSLTCTGGTPLKFASNVEYEIYCDNEFVGVGGHRCTLHEAYIDEWVQCAQAKEVRIRLHWITPKTKGAHATQVKLLEVNASKWNLVPLPVDHMQINRVPPLQINKGVLLPHKNATTPYIFKDGEDVTDIIFKTTVILTYETYDLHSIGLSKVITEDSESSAGKDKSSVDQVVIVYSEVPNFSEVWSTANRRKVRMADAVVSKKGNPYGLRGCRYVHILTTKPTIPGFTAYRATYPLPWRYSESEIANDPLLFACVSNLKACVDGGIVDTCWRERVQWVGDLRMSAKALRVLTTDTKVVSFVLHQIADSYDSKVGLVQGAWPCRSPNYKLQMPLYHLAFCLTALEHDPTLKFSERVKNVVRDSVTFWRDNYLANGLIKGTPGWMFVDWDFTNDEVSARNEAQSLGINSVSNSS